MVHLSVLAEHVSRPDKIEPHAGIPALVVEGLHPRKIARTLSVVVLAVAQDLGELPRGKELFHVHLRQDRGDHKRLVPCRNVQQDRQPFVRPCLVLGGNAQGDVVPACAPVLRQVRCNAFRPLGLNPEQDVRTLTYHLPDLHPPRIRLLQKEIRGHAHVQHRPRRNLVSALPCLFQREIEVCLGAVDLAAVPLPLGIEIVHVAVLAALAVLAASMPRIPYCHFHPIISQGVCAVFLKGSL